MSTSENLRAKRIEVTSQELIVELDDGSRHAAPVALFPILVEASPDELANWETIGGGRGIYWPQLDEHVSVFSIVHPDRTVPMRRDRTEQLLARNRERRGRRAG